MIEIMTTSNKLQPHT